MQFRTQSTAPLADALVWLNKITPAQHVVHVGVGVGAGPCHVWRNWPVSQASMIDANAERLAWVEPLAVEHPGWQAFAALLAAEAGEAVCYRASNPDESGLLPPDKLRSLWPNLAVDSAESREAQRLEDVLGADAAPDWLIVDCLPALAILRGAWQILGKVNILCLRCLLNPQGTDIEQAGLPVLESALQPMGFRRVETIESNHPAIGHALFVRDWTTQLDTLTQTCNMLEQEKSALAARRDELQKEIAALAQACDQQTQLAEKRQAQNQELTQTCNVLEQEKSALAARRDELQKEIAALAQACDQQTQLAEKRQAQNQELTQTCNMLEQEKSALAARRDELQKETAALAQARDQQTQLAEKRQAQNQELTQTCNMLEQEKSALAARRDELENQLKQKNEQIVQLEHEMAERDARQHLLNEEITRAEAQIDLIKDVLLREPGL